ncbi:MAG: PQQ-binding-like beta-propeller repeat protein, partial [Candidatus Bathyarchaeia archaeon]
MVMKSYPQVIVGLCLLVAMDATDFWGAQMVELSYLSPRWSQQLFGGIIEDSSPTLYDLDGDGRLEVVIATTNKRWISDSMDKNASSVLAVLEDNGTIKWQVVLPDPVYSSPAVADISYPP